MLCIRHAVCDFCDARCADYYKKRCVWEVTIYDPKVKDLVKKYFADEQDADEFVMQIHNNQQKGEEE